MYICLKNEILNSTIPLTMLYKFKNSHGVMEGNSTIELSRTSDTPTWADLISYGVLTDVMYNGDLTLAKIIISNTSPAYSDILAMSNNASYPENYLIDNEEANDIIISFNFTQENN